MTTYPLSDTDREIQARARGFVDEDLIPHALRSLHDIFFQKLDPRIFE